MGVKHMYVGDTNAMNQIIIRDMDTDTAAVVEWDLSDDEIKEIADKFTADQNDESWYADEPKWEDWETVRDRLNTFWNIMDFLDRKDKEDLTMAKKYNVNGGQVEFIKINMICDGEEIEGLLLHNCNDEFSDGDCITGEHYDLPDDDEEAQTIIENCYWITYWHRDQNTGNYISEE